MNYEREEERSRLRRKPKRLMKAVLYHAAHPRDRLLFLPPCSSKAIGSVPGRPQDHRMCLGSIWGRAVHPWGSREVACRARARRTLFRNKLLEASSILVRACTILVRDCTILVGALLVY